MSWHTQIVAPAVIVATGAKPASLGLATDGVFVFVGMAPRTDLLEGVVSLDEWGYVETGDSTATAIPGLHMAGDLRAKKLRQITTAVADGTIAALAVQKLLRERRA